MRLDLETSAYRERGFNCAQSVFTPFATRLGIDEALALKISAPFGGGMGHMGQTCGAVCGALMAIGMAEGTTPGRDVAQKEACNKLAQAFETQFVELHGDLSCQGLLGLDLGVPAELQVAKDEGLFQTLCPVFVADASRLARDLLKIPD